MELVRFLKSALPNVAFKGFEKNPNKKIEDELQGVPLSWSQTIASTQICSYSKMNLSFIFCTFLMIF